MKNTAGSVLFIFTTDERKQYVQDRNEGTLNMELAWDLFKEKYPHFVKELFFQLFEMYLHIGGDLSFFYAHYDYKFEILKLSTADGRVIKYF